MLSVAVNAQQAEQSDDMLNVCLVSAAAVATPTAGTCGPFTSARSFPSSSMSDSSRKPSPPVNASKELPGAPRNELGTLVVVVLKARNLNNLHFYKSDVFSKITLEGETKKTSVDVKGGQHPVWDSELRFIIYETKSDKPRKLEVSCWGKEPRVDEVLGEGSIDLAETLKTGEFDDWIPLKFNGTQRGDLYLEMTFYASTPAPARPNRPATTAPLLLAPSASSLTRRPSKLSQKERLQRPPSDQNNVPTSDAAALHTLLEDEEPAAAGVPSALMSGPRKGAPQQSYLQPQQSHLQPQQSNLQPDSQKLGYVPSILRPRNPKASPTPIRPPTSNQNPDRIPPSDGPAEYVSVLHTRRASNEAYTPRPSNETTYVPLNYRPDHERVTSPNPNTSYNNNAPSDYVSARQQRTPSFGSQVPPQGPATGPWRTDPYAQSYDNNPAQANTGPVSFPLPSATPAPTDNYSVNPTNSQDFPGNVPYSHNGPQPYFQPPAPTPTPSISANQHPYFQPPAPSPTPNIIQSNPYFQPPPPSQTPNIPPMNHHPNLYHSPPPSRQGDRNNGDLNPYLIARYTTPLPLPPGATREQAHGPSRSPPRAPSLPEKPEPEKQKEPTPLPVEKEKPAPAPQPENPRIRVLREAEEQAAKRKEQEERDMELARMLDRELNLEIIQGISH